MLDSACIANKNERLKSTFVKWIAAFCCKVTLRLSLFESTVMINSSVRTKEHGNILIHANTGKTVKEVGLYAALSINNIRKLKWNFLKYPTFSAESESPCSQALRKYFHSAMRGHVWYSKGSKRVNESNSNLNTVSSFDRQKGKQRKYTPMYHHVGVNSNLSNRNTSAGGSFWDIYTSSEEEDDLPQRDSFSMLKLSPPRVRSAHSTKISISKDNGESINCVDALNNTLMNIGAIVDVLSDSNSLSYSPNSTSADEVSFVYNNASISNISVDNNSPNQSTMTFPIADRNHSRLSTPIDVKKIHSYERMDWNSVVYGSFLKHQSILDDSLLLACK